MASNDVATPRQSSATGNDSWETPAPSSAAKNDWESQVRREMIREGSWLSTAALCEPIMVLRT
jgi:hypothetical protein